jgi:hypothetical protein
MRYQGKEETMPTWGWIVISLALLAALEAFGGHSRPRLA